ncbi:hypothetical protein L9F63_011300, partial [Diploptera punctata]
GKYRFSPTFEVEKCQRLRKTSNKLKVGKSRDPSKLNEYYVLRSVGSKNLKSVLFILHIVKTKLHHSGQRLHPHALALMHAYMNERIFSVALPANCRRFL